MPDFDVNLDADLENIQAESEGSPLDKVDLSGFGEVVSTVDFPAFKVDTQKLKAALRTAKLVSASTGRDILSKTVLFQPFEDTVICRMTDFDVFISVKLPNIVEGQKLLTPVIIQVDILEKLLKAVPARTLFYKDDAGLKVRLVGGDIPVETVEASPDKFVPPDTADKIGQVKAEKLYGLLKDLSPIVQAAMVPNERRIAFSADKAMASYLFGIVGSPGTFPGLDLRSKDIAILRVLTSGTDDELNLYKVDGEVPRVAITSPTFRYTFLHTTGDFDGALTKALGGLPANTGTYVDFVQLYKMVELAADLPYATQRIDLNYSEKGEVLLTVKVKKGNGSTFTMGDPMPGVTPIAKPLSLQAKLLRVSLKAFSDSVSVRVVIQEGVLGIVSDKYRAVFFSDPE